LWINLEKGAEAGKNPLQRFGRGKKRKRKVKWDK